VDALSIRMAGPADLPDLMDLYQHLTPGDERPTDDDAANILDELGRFAGSGVLVGLVDDVIVASCTLVVMPNLTRGGSPYALLENVVTDNRFRKRGYGTRLLHAAVAAAWERGCYKVMLMTGSKDPATLKFYADAGFEQSKTGFQMRRMSLQDN
jgi:GNAT superfamily N-acetyltransferase